MKGEQQYRQAPGTDEDVGVCTLADMEPPKSSKTAKAKIDKALEKYSSSKQNYESSLQDFIDRCVC